MSASPNMMQMLLAQHLMQQPQSQTAGGGAAGPQMQGQTSPMGTGAQLAQKLMLMQALQNQQTPQAPQQPPQQPPQGTYG